MISNPVSADLVVGTGDGDMEHVHESRCWPVRPPRPGFAGAGYNAMIVHGRPGPRVFDEVAPPAADAGVSEVVIAWAWTRVPGGCLADGTVVCRTSPGAGIQISHVAPAWRAAGFAAGERSHRPSSGLAKGTAAGFEAIEARVVGERVGAITAARAPGSVVQSPSVHQQAEQLNLASTSPAPIL